MTSLYHNRIETREALDSELYRLQQLGWIDRTLEWQWVITRPGEEAVSTAMQWTVEVDEIVDEQQDDVKEVVVVGRLTSGSVAFFLHGSFTVTRQRADIGGGFVNGFGTTEDSANPRYVALLTLPDMDDRLRQGDVLRSRTL